MVKIVFDIGGTNMRVAEVEMDQVVNIQKMDTPQDPQEGIERFIDMARGVADGRTIEALAGGFAGVVTDGLIVRSGNLPRWDGLPLASEMSARLNARTTLINDAAAAALGEAECGAGIRYDIVGYICVGTGVGGAKVVDGKLDPVCHGHEPGEQIIDIAKRRTLGRIVSGAALEKRYVMKPSELSRSHYDNVTPCLAAGIYNCVMLWSPEVVILGGSLINEQNGYRIRDIEAALRGLDPVMLPDIRAAELKDDAGLCGAAILFA